MTGAGGSSAGAGGVVGAETPPPEGPPAASTRSSTTRFAGPLDRPVARLHDSIVGRVGHELRRRWFRVTTARTGHLGNELGRISIVRLRDRVHELRPRRLGGQAIHFGGSPLHLEPL